MPSGYYLAICCCWDSSNLAERWKPDLFPWPHDDTRDRPTQHPALQNKDGDCKTLTYLLKHCPFLNSKKHLFRKLIWTAPRGIQNNATMVTPAQTYYRGDACNFVNWIQRIEWQKVSETSRLFFLFVSETSSKAIFIWNRLAALL